MYEAVSLRLMVSREILKCDEPYESILKDPQPIYCKLRVSRTKMH